MTQILTAILIYCQRPDIPAGTHKQCRQQLLECVLNETIIPKDVKLVQCIKQRDK